MNKIITSIIALVIIAIILFGCGNTVSDSNNEETYYLGIPEGEPIIRENPTEPPTEEPTEPYPKMGTVVVDRLNVRKEPYIDKNIVYQLAIDTRIEILEVKILDAIPWGRIANGWINLRYIDLDGEE